MDWFGFDRRKDAAEELVRGREFAEQLGGLLRSSTSQDLISRILTSFSNTLSILNHSDSDESAGDSSITCNRSRPGCYKRKRSHSWARESGNLVDDGHAWRKYGQKVILNAKYPRNYYRCTHKFDQSCQATKQVQQLQDNPPNFRTTYYGNHTCTNFLAPSEIVLGSSSNFDHDSSEVLLSFDIAQPQPQPLHDHFLLPPVKKEQLLVLEATTTANPNNNVCSPSDYISAGPSPDHLSVLDFDDGDDDALQFHF